MIDDLRAIREAYKRATAIEAFVSRIRDSEMTQLIANSGNVEIVNTTAARLRDEAEQLLSEPAVENARRIVANHYVSEVQKRLDAEKNLS